MPDIYRITRAQLSAVFKDEDAVRAMEALFENFNDQTSAGQVDDAAIAAAIASAQANMARGDIARLADEVTRLADLLQQPVIRPPAQIPISLVQQAPVVKPAISPSINSLDNKPIYDRRAPSQFLDFMDMATSLPNPPHTEGRSFYDNTEKALSYYTEIAGLTIATGQELVLRVLNNSGAAMTDGQVVYVNGASGGLPTVALARADAAATSQTVAGLITTPIANGAIGYMTVSGTVGSVNTAAWAPGTQLYLSETVAGGMTSTPPSQPNYEVLTAIVLRQNATDGRVLVGIDNRPWLPSITLVDTRATVALPTTPTIYIPPTIEANQGFSYDNTTGQLTVLIPGAYSLLASLNCQAPSANKNVFIFVQILPPGANDITGWVTVQNSGRRQELVTGNQTQIPIIGSNQYPRNTRLRFWIWCDASVNLVTTLLPNTPPGAPRVAAFRLQIA